MWNIRSNGRRVYISFYQRSRFQIECWSFLSGKKGFKTSWYLHNSGTSFQTREMQRNCTIDASTRAKGRRSDLLEIPPVSCEVLTHLNGRALCGWLMVKEGSQGQGGWDQNKRALIKSALTLRAFTVVSWGRESQKKREWAQKMLIKIKRMPWSKDRMDQSSEKPELSPERGFPSRDDKKSYDLWQNWCLKLLEPCHRCPILQVGNLLTRLDSGWDIEHVS